MTTVIIVPIYVAKPQRYESGNVVHESFESLTLRSCGKVIPCIQRVYVRPRCFQCHSTKDCGRVNVRADFVPRQPQVTLTPDLSIQSEQLNPRMVLMQTSANQNIPNLINPETFSNPKTFPQCKGSYSVTIYKRFYRTLSTNKVNEAVTGMTVFTNNSI